MKSSGLNKKLISVLLSLIMVLSTLMGGGISAFAADSGVEEVVTVEEPSSLDTPASEPGISDPEDEGSKSSPESTPAISEEGSGDEQEGSSGDKQEESAPEKTEPAAGTGSGEEYVPMPDQGETGSVQEIVSKAESVPEAAPVIVYPARDFKGETSELNVRVHAPEGVFPAGTRMNLRAVPGDILVEAAKENGIEEASYAVAVDITFADEKGADIQPNGEVTVSLVARKKLEGEEHQAVTMDDEGNVEVVADASAKRSVFETDHFTVYGIIGSEYEDDVEQYVRHTYEFYAGDPSADPSTWTKVDSQIVKNGDALTLPADPECDTRYVFDGWYKEGDTEKLSGGEVEIVPEKKSDDPEASDLTIKVYAKFDRLYTVTLYTDEEKSAVFDTKLAKDGESVDIPSAETAQENGLIVPFEKTMDGWRYAGEGGAFVENDVVIIDGADVELVPDFAGIHRVRFDLLKEDFDDEEIADEFVKDGETVAEPEYIIGNVYRGYEFGGWYTRDNYHPEAGDPEDEFTGEPFDFTVPLTREDDEEIMLFAKWTPVEFIYTVEVYREKNSTLNPEFNFYASSKKTAEDETVPIASLMNEFTKTKYEYFHRSGDGVVDKDGGHAFIEVVNGDEVVPYDSAGECKGDESKAVILPNRTTVIRIYYCRDTYYLHFLFSNRGSKASDVGPIVSSADATGSYSRGVWTTLVSTKLSSAGKQYAPAGFADAQLPTLPAKYGESTGTVIYGLYPEYADLFDAFVRSENWYIERQDYNRSGEVYIDGIGSGSAVKPNSNIGDGGDVHVLIFHLSGKKRYLVKKLYYDKDYTVAQLKEGGITPVSSTIEEGYYYAGGTNGHGTKIPIGTKSGGYKAVWVSNFNLVQLYITGNYVPEGVDLPEGEHQFTWKNGRADQPAIGEEQAILRHYVPLRYNITFKQTSEDGRIHGWDISEDSREEDVVIESVLFGSEIDIEQLIADNGLDGGSWIKMKDDEGRTYISEADAWAGDMTEEGTFPATMPSKNLVFYKNWNTYSYTVTFDLNGYEVDGKEIHDFKDIPWNGSIPDPKAEGLIDRGEGWALLKWHAFERNEDGTKGDPISDFSMHTPVKRDYYLVAEWARGEIFNVEYDEGEHGTLDGADQGILLDDETYLVESKATVKYIPTPDEGYVFIGWALGGDTSKMYGGGDLIEYTEENDAAGRRDKAEKDRKIVLVAQYEKMEHVTSMTYHSNYPGGDDETADVDEMTPNGTFNVRGPDDAAIGFESTYTDPEGRSFSFKCWTNTPGEQIYSGSSDREYFMAGEDAAAGIDDNHLYAVWELVQEYIEITVRKEWDDDDDRDGVRPDHIIVSLLADGSTVETAEVTETDGWSYTFTDLLKYDTETCEKIEYTVEEEVIEEYEDPVIEGDQDAGFTITNVHEPEETEVFGEKIWDDDNDRDGRRPDSITVDLLANGTKIDSAEVNEAGGWSFKFEGLPRYADGEEIEYTVEEEAVEGYLDPVIEGDRDEGFTVTNPYTPEKTSVFGNKVWQDEKDKYGKRPKSITVRLFANGEEIDSKEVTAADDWSFIFEDLYMYEGGQAINYTISEDAVPEYTTEVNEETYTITNTYKPPKKDEPPKKPNVPKTGDDSRAALWLALLLMAGAAVLAVMKRRRRA